MSEKCTPLWRGALSEVAMSKKCTPLWCEAHFEVTIYKTPQPRSTTLITLHYATATATTAATTTTTLRYTALHDLHYTTLQLQLHYFTIH